jgi:hypothetical protein
MGSFHESTRSVEAEATFVKGYFPAPAVITTVNYTYNSCRLVHRTITGSTGELIQQESYTYDSAGHVAARSGVVDGQAYGETYDYSCW